MAKRTYLPALLYLLNAVCTYIGRRREKINANVGAEGVPLVDAVVEACMALTELLIEIIPRGD